MNCFSENVSFSLIILCYKSCKNDVILYYNTKILTQNSNLKENRIELVDLLGCNSIYSTEV